MPFITGRRSFRFGKFCSLKQRFSFRLFVYFCVCSFVSVISISWYLTISTKSHVNLHMAFATATLKPEVNESLIIPNEIQSVGDRMKKLLTTSNISNSTTLSSFISHPITTTQTTSNNQIPIHHIASQSINFTNEVQLSFINGVKSDEFKKIANKCNKNTFKDNETPVPVNWINYPVILENVDICKGKVFLVTVVHSIIANRDRRDLIRSTWGSLRMVEERRVVLLFFVGVSKSAMEQQLIMEENAIYSDIVQIEFIDDIRNQTIKHLSHMKWIGLHCPKVQYLLKANDDTFVDPFHVIDFLTMHPINGFLCKAGNKKPFRSADSKWYVSKETFPDENYPDHCGNGVYIMNATWASQIYWCSTFVPYFWIDNVYVTGILRNRFQISRQDFWAGHGLDDAIPSYASEKLNDVMFLLGNDAVVHDIWLRLWKTAINFNFM